jgi:phage terminase large subunit
MELTIKPTIRQHDCYQAIDTQGIDEVFFGGGAGGGKSWAICESRLIKAVRFPGYKSFIGRNELKRLMQSTFITWSKVCAHHKIPKDKWKLDGKYNVIEMWNGSKIDLIDLAFQPSDPLYERFGSLEYSDGAIEEAGETHPLSREVLKTRVNRHMNDVYGINPCILDTGNPKKNWTYHVFYKPWKEGRLPENMRFIQALYKDNPHAQSTYDKTLSGIKDKVMRQRLKDGNWEYEDDPSVLMNYEAITDLFTNFLPEEDEFGAEIPRQKYATIDVARFGGDKIVLTCWRGWEAYKISWKEKQSLETTKLWLQDELRKEGIPRSHTMADEDGVGGGLVDMMPGIKGFIANSSPVETEAIEELTYDEQVERQKESKIVYGNLKTQCAYVLAEKVNNRICSVKTDDTQIKTWLIEDLEQIKESNIDSDDKKKRLVPKDEIKETLGRSPDFGDTFIMRAAFELKEPQVIKEAVQTRPAWISRRQEEVSLIPSAEERISQTRPTWIKRR